MKKLNIGFFADGKWAVEFALAEVGWFHEAGVPEGLDALEELFP